MLMTQDMVDSCQGLPSMIDEKLDLEDRHSLSSSDISDREHGSLRSDSFNGFDHGNIVMADIFEHDELASTQNRLETFQLWPASSAIKPVDLAAAGFYYLGADDQVKCYKCDLILRQWRLGEDPWVEHKRFRPSCQFIREIDGGKRFQVTCKPIELSSSAQDKEKLLFSQRVTGYGELRYPSALPGEQYAPNVASQTERVPADPRFSPYPERLREHVTNEERAFDFQERPYMAPRPSNAGNRQVGFPSRMQEFQGRDIQSSAYHRAEQSVAESLPRNQYVVVRQGSDQVHIQGAAVYQLHPEDNVYVRVEGQGFPRQLSSVRESLHPKRNEASESHSETMSTAPQSTYKESNQSSYLHESRKHQSPFTQASEESGRPFAYETRPFETGSGIPSYTPQHSGGGAVQHPAMAGAHQDRRHFLGSFEGGHDKPPVRQMQQAREAIMFPVQSGQAYHEPCMAQNKGTNEESSGMPHFPETESQTGVAETNYPTQPSRETSGLENSPEHSVHGSRSRFPRNVAFPVQTPSLGTVQGPLFKQEEARHVTSPSEMSSEHHRLTTFVDWPQDCPIREWELSVAGFYYLGCGDNVKCYKCGIALRNWDPTDTPWGEHKKWSPNCPLVIEHFSGRGRRKENVHHQRMTSGERFTFSSEELQRHRPERNYWQVPVRRSGSPPRCPREQSEQRPTQAICSSSSQFCSLSEQGNRPSYSHGVPISSLEEGHVVSGPEAVSSGEVISRPENVRPLNETSISQSENSTVLELDIERLVEMGFTRKEVDEAVSKQIEDTGSTFDSFGQLVLALLERHDERQPDQESLPPHSPLDVNENPLRPLVTIPTIITSPLFREIEGNRTRSSASAVSSPTTPKPQRDSLRRCLSAPVASMCESEESLEQKLERMQEERTCKICMDEEVSVVFQPCGHLSCCAECASGMELCPMCRAPIQEKIRTYLS